MTTSLGQPAAARRDGRDEGGLSRLLEIEDLYVPFRTPTGLVRAVDGISYSVGEGETVAVVGESGVDHLPQDVP